MKSVLIIPAYKPNQTFIKFIEELKNLGFDKIITINDGSGHQYDNIFNAIESKNVTVVKLDNNTGKGNAIKVGIYKAINLWGKIISVTIADCDGQHLPSDIYKIANKLENEDSKLILATRNFNRENVPFKSKIGNKISAFLFELSTKTKCPDTECGLRGIPANIIPTALSSTGNGYEYEINFLYNAIKQFKVDFVPIETIYKDNNKNSHFRPIMDSFRILCNLIKFAFKINTKTYWLFYFLFIFLYSAFVIFDAFLIPKVYEKAGYVENIKDSISSNAFITDSSYITDDVSIHIKDKMMYGERIYIADIKTANPAKLKTGLAEKAYGKNINKKASEIANDYNSIIAINGDNYSFRDKGWVMRNGKFYRKTLSDWGFEDFVIYDNGTFDTIDETKTTPDELIKNHATQVISFGPTLVKNGQIVFRYKPRYGYLRSKQPRTAICQAKNNHYLFVVTDGRIKKNSGLTMYELADTMKELGCLLAYNLDGGGSSTMIFNNRLVNKPSTWGDVIKEREISDIIYVER